MKQWQRRDVLKLGTFLCLPIFMPSLAGCMRDKENEATAEGFSFIDMAGRQVSLPRPAERIVTMVVPDAAAAIAVQGSADRLVGIHPRARDMFSRGFISRLFPEVMALPTNIVVGSDFVPDSESIARLQPDVVVQYGGRGDDLIAPLENLGLKVARFVANGAGGKETLTAMLTMMGAMVGNVSQARDLIQFRDRVDRRVRQMLNSLREVDRQRAIIAMPLGDGLLVSGGQDVMGYYLYEAGGINAAEAAPGFSQVSAEQIAAWDPDVVFLFGGNATSPERVYRDPILGATHAAREQRVYVMPIGSHSWGSIGPEDPLTQIWMAELLYPELLPNMLRDEMKALYRLAFGHEFSDAEIDEVLMLERNALSAHYRRFATERS